MKGLGAKYYHKNGKWVYPWNDYKGRILVVTQAATLGFRA